MTLLKFITKLWSTPDKIADSTVEVELALPKLSRQNLFDEAVKKQVALELRETLKEELAQLCYSAEVIEDTRQAIQAYGKHPTPEQIKAAKLLYPECIEAVIYPYRDNSSQLALEFNIDKFVNKLVDKELDNAITNS